MDGIAYETWQRRAAKQRFEDRVQCQGCGHLEAVALTEVLRANDWPVCEHKGCPDRGQVMVLLPPKELP